jgi:hypothetical protein
MADQHRLDNGGVIKRPQNPEEGTTYEFNGITYKARKDNRITVWDVIGSSSGGTSSGQYAITAWVTGHNVRGDTLLPGEFTSVFDLNNSSEWTTSPPATSYGNVAPVSSFGTFDPNGGDVIVHVSYSQHGPSMKGGAIDQAICYVKDSATDGDKTKIKVLASSSPESAGNGLSESDGELAYCNITAFQVSPVTGVASGISNIGRVLNLGATYADGVDAPYFCGPIPEGEWLVQLQAQQNISSGLDEDVSVNVAKKYTVPDGMYLWFKQQVQTATKSGFCTQYTNTSDKPVVGGTDWHEYTTTSNPRAWYSGDPAKPIDAGITFHGGQAGNPIPAGSAIELISGGTGSGGGTLNVYESPWIAQPATAGDGNNVNGILLDINHNLNTKYPSNVQIYIARDSDGTDATMVMQAGENEPGDEDADHGWTIDRLTDNSFRLIMTEQIDYRGHGDGRDSIGAGMAGLQDETTMTAENKWTYELTAAQPWGLGLYYKVIVTGGPGGTGGSSTGPRAYVAFDGTATNMATELADANSHNVASITDNGVGDYTINFSTPVSKPIISVGYQVRTSTPFHSLYWGVLEQTDSSVRIGIGSDNVYYDHPYVSFIAH